jgi:hypothetical protein
VKRTNIFAALSCALLVCSLLGCGASNKLQSIQLSTSNSAESAPGTLDLLGEGGTQQLYLWGNYTNGKAVFLDVKGASVTYNISVTPGSTGLVEGSGDNYVALPDPPETVLLSVTGLLTAVQPFACTWVNTATTGTTPAWALSGSYEVTATYQGFTSPPTYVAVASEAGIASATNPTGECGPQPGQ